ncbi:hypothetical protein V6N11_066436 [Hibiscus sabdariffa]|uniref:Uncharacterized protein n=2 Tax=Hibiscus sabdariffa TaxID=183260 RepID=A0ABR2NFI4_9ROSI
MRTMERLNGFSVYGFRLTVKLANPKKRNQFPNQVGLNRGKSAVISTPRQSKQEQVHSKEPGDSSSQAKVVLKKIVGHVEDEDLWRMKRCLVNRIEEIVELNVGNMKYEINVVEIGFKDETCDPLLMKGNMNKIDHFGDSIMENQSESSPDTGKSSLPLDDKLNCSIEKDALEVMNIGSKPKGNVERRIESSSKSAQSKSSDKMNRNWSKVVAKPESNVGAKQGVHESGGG